MSSSTDQNPEEQAAPAPEAGPQRIELPPPLPSHPVTDQPGMFDRLVSFVELYPLPATLVILVGLVAAHVVIMNLAGVMSGMSVQQSLFMFQPAGFADVLLLALIAYNVVLPTFLARSGLTAFADVAGSLTCNDKVYDDHLHELASAHLLVRLVFGFFWAAILTPVFGSVLQGLLPGGTAGTPMLTIWMFVRLALVFFLVGSSLSYLAMLHYRLSAALGQFLRVELFDMEPLQPLARHIANATIFLSIPVALVGPIMARPEAVTASATVLGFAATLVLAASFGSMWGARRAIRGAKLTALTELHAYSREIWRRAYVNGRITEAVALPAMAGMITIRNQVARMSNWPGGWTSLARCFLLATLPAFTWFGGLMLSWLLAIFVP